MVAPTRRRWRDAVGLANHAVLHNDRLPFVFEASGSETQFTNGFDPSPRARTLFNFPKPETRARIMRDAESNLAARTWRAKVQAMPAKFDEFDGYRPRPNCCDDRSRPVGLVGELSCLYVIDDHLHPGWQLLYYGALQHENEMDENDAQGICSRNG